MARQNVVFYYMQIPFLAFCLVGCKILRCLDFVPVARWVSHEKSDSISTAPLEIRVTHRLVEPSIYRRHWRNRRDQVAPSFLNLLERNGSPATYRSTSFWYRAFPNSTTTST